MTKRRKAKKTAGTKKAPARPLTPAQIANQVTWQLKGSLKNARLAYLRVGTLLARVRDNKLHEALGFSTLEEYAENRLQLGRTSLYKYLQVRDWVSQVHPEWLLPHPEGFIPELDDAADLMYVEHELLRTDLDPAKRAALEVLKKKALAGSLRSRELDPYRKPQRTDQDILKSALSQLRQLRRRWARLRSMPPEVLSCLDNAIEVLKNDKDISRVKLPGT